MTAPTYRATADVTVTGTGERFLSGDVVPPGNTLDYLISLGLAAITPDPAPAAPRKES